MVQRIFISLLNVEESNAKTKKAALKLLINGGGGEI
tara:strand:+ start:411 stop:518 length:108 start_codon:yes stop_codon:yes gene_type:complete